MSFKRGQLLYFVTVVEEGQITRAAKKLHLAQPALSQAIAQLESELGIKLLDRQPHGVALTPDGELFYEKARAALAAATDALQTAQSLARAQKGTLTFGFLGVPPGLDSPAPMERFAALHPSIDIHYRELPFPSPPTSSWLAEVDVAACHAPPVDPNVWAQDVRSESRIVLAPGRHPLAERSELTVAEVIDETFIGLHDSTEPAWAGFWSLDSHRGGPPRDVTPDRAANPQEVLAALAVRHAITTVPASVARVIPKGVVAIPLRDAEPSVIRLVGHNDRRNPLVIAVAAFARSVTDDNPALLS